MARQITRLRLLRSMQQALIDGHLLIEAPAGYGKSLLLGQLAAQRPHTFLLSLEPAAIDLGVLRPLLEPHLQPGHTLLLDDSQHLIGGEAASAWLQGKLGRHDLRFVVAGRALPFSSPGLAAQLRLTHWAGDRLRFDDAECRVLLDAVTPDQAAQWREQLAGWPLGLGLLAHLPPTQAPLDLAREQLFDYLATEVMARLSPDIQRFLRLTAVPLRFNRDLAAMLLAGFLRPGEDAATLLREVQRQNLFILPAQEPGWFRYHQVMRDFLLADPGFDPRPVHEQVADWRQARGELDSAIEQAVAGDLQARLAEFLIQLPSSFIYERGRYLTYRRWVDALDDRHQELHPEVLLRASRYMYFVNGFEVQGRQYAERARQLALRAGRPRLAVRAELQLVWIRQNSAGTDEALLAGLQAILDNPHCTGRDRLRALRLLAGALSQLAHFRAARRIYAEAAALAGELGDEKQRALIRRNLALNVLVQLGDYPAAQAIYEQVLAHFAGQPGRQAEIISNRSDLWLAQGDWDRLAGELAELAKLAGEVDEIGAHVDLWTNWFHAKLAAGRRELARADIALAAMEAVGDEDPLTQVCLAWAAWRKRRGGDLAGAMAVAGAALDALPHSPPYYLAQLALERDIAATLGVVVPPPLHPATLRFIGWRARADLVRLRAVLALRCFRAGDPRWRRHAQAALFGLRRPAFELLLTGRDPQLGSAFWLMLLRDGRWEEQARTALCRIGEYAPILPLLADGEPVFALAPRGRWPNWARKRACRPSPRRWRANECGRIAHCCRQRSIGWKDCRPGRLKSTCWAAAWCSEAATCCRRLRFTGPSSSACCNTWPCTRPCTAAAA